MTASSGNASAKSRGSLKPYPPEDASRLANVNVGQRRLKRLFNNGSFEQHGRLYGGFWLPMKSEDRHYCLTIKGSPIAVLDFGRLSFRSWIAHRGRWYKLYISY